MKVEQPKTIEDYEKILHEILEMQGNPYCDHLMFMDLLHKRENVEAKIAELNGM